MNRNRLWMIVLTAGTLLLVLLIVSDWLPFLRGPAPETAEWYWPYRLRPFALWLKPLLAASLFWGVAVWWLRLKEVGEHSSSRAPKTGLWLLAAASLLLQLALMNADSTSIQNELLNRVYSNLESGFFQPAAELPDLRHSLQDYAALMPTFTSEHARTHPPGLLMANRLTMELLAYFPTLSEQLARPAVAAQCIDLWLLERPTAVSAALLIWAIVPLLAAALTIFPAYWVARLTLNGYATKLAALLVATLPALLLFAPKPVQFYAPLSLLIFYAFYRGLQKWSVCWFFFSGLLLSLATFLSLGNFALALLLLVYAGLHVLSIQACRHSSEQVPSSPGHLISSSPHHPITPSPPHLITLLKCAAAFAVGTAVLWLIFWMGWGVPPWLIFQTGLGQHYELVTRLRRYEWWVVWDLLDVLLFAGWVVVAGFTAVLMQSFRRPFLPIQRLAISTAVLLVVLDISGSARGEVGRLWLFFFPFLALVAAHWLAESQRGWQRQAALVAMQLLLLLALALAWRPVQAVTVEAQRPSFPTTTPETTTDVLFGDGIRLTGTTISPTETTLQATLFWRLEKAVLRPYTVFTQLLNEQNQLVAQQDNWPVNGQWPPTCWQIGETVADSYTLPLPPDLPPGTYRLIVGWYDARDGRRLLTPSAEDAYLLLQFTIP